MSLLGIVGAAMLVAALATGPLLFLAIAVQGFCAGALMPMMMNTLMNMPQVGAGYMGAAAGLYFTIGEIGGFAGPTVIGLMVGLTGTFTAGVLILSLTMWAMILPASRLPLTSDDRD
jgi:MFS family permease